MNKGVASAKIENFKMMGFEANSSYYIMNYDTVEGMMGTDIISYTQPYTDRKIVGNEFVYIDAASNVRFHDHSSILNGLQSQYIMYLIVSSQYNEKLQLIFDLRYISIDQSDQSLFSPGQIKIGTDFPFIYNLSTNAQKFTNDIVKIIDISVSNTDYDYEMNQNCDVFGLYYAEIPTSTQDNSTTYAVNLRLFEICIVDIDTLQFSFNWVTDDFQINTISTPPHVVQINIASNAAKDTLFCGWLESYNASDTKAYGRMINIKLDIIESVSIEDKISITPLTSPIDTGVPGPRLSDILSCDKGS